VVGTASVISGTAKADWTECEIGDTEGEVEVGAPTAATVSPMWDRCATGTTTPSDVGAGVVDVDAKGVVAVDAIFTTGAMVGNVGTAVLLLALADAVGVARPRDRERVCASAVGTGSAVNQHTNRRGRDAHFKKEKVQVPPPPPPPQGLKFPAYTRIPPSPLWQHSLIYDVPLSRAVRIWSSSCSSTCKSMSGTLNWWEEVDAAGRAELWTEDETAVDNGGVMMTGRTGSEGINGTETTVSAELY
jgi:hypothetical protein